MLTHARPAIVLLVLLTALTGIAYPLVVTGVGQVAFREQANGSPVMVGQNVAGSALIGQAFASDRYFHGRPSAAGNGYDASASSGSNLGPLSKKLLDRVAVDAKALQPDAGDRPIPADAVTASGSGLDPHISPAYALLQAKRVALARGLEVAKVETLIADHTQNRVLGILGEPRVNVLLLNRALDALPSG
jgi:K+-transporting ATPase ATPase C chain